MASPCATGFSILNILHTMDAKQAPNIPVIIIQATVIAGIPPISSVKPMAMAVVIDLAITDAAKVVSNVNNLISATKVTMQATQPDAIPNTMAFKFFFNTSYCRYSGTARHTVVGVKK